MVGHLEGAPFAQVVVFDLFVRFSVDVFRVEIRAIQVQVLERIDGFRKIEGTRFLVFFGKHDHFGVRIHVEADLIVVHGFAQVRGVLLDGVGNLESVFFERSERGVAGVEDVEVAQKDVVFVFLLGTFGEKRSESVDFSEAARVVLLCGAVVDMNRGQDKAEPAGLECDAIRRARELQFSVDGQTVGQDDFTGHFAEEDFALVIHERRAFAAAGGAFGAVGGYVVPVVTEQGDEFLQPSEVGGDFLDGNEVEAADDFSEVVEAFGAAVVAEFSNVPSGEQERVSRGLGGNVAVKLVAQLKKFFRGAFSLVEVLDSSERLVGRHGEKMVGSL